MGAAHLALWGLVGLDYEGVHLPLLRQIVGFACLSILPGMIILAILKLDEISIAEKVAYGTAASISLALLLGGATNLVLPLFGISRPLSEIPVLASLTVVTAALCTAMHLARHDAAQSRASSPKFGLTCVPLRPVIFLVLLWITAPLGAYQLNAYGDNRVMLLFLLLVVSVPLLACFTTFIPEKLYPMAVLSVSASLLLHQSLISNYLVGWDIQGEYYYQRLVVAQGYWNPALPSDLNAMLSVTVLGPVYSFVMNLDLVWVDKIVYPLLFSVVPVALYTAYSKQMDAKNAFLAVFFFMATFVFFTEMLQLLRQQVAEVFFATSILAIVEQRFTRLQRVVLLIVFGMSMVVSHYGLAYLYLIFVAALLVSRWLPGLRRMSGAEGTWIVGEGTQPRQGTEATLVATKSTAARVGHLGAGFLGLIFAFTLGWYMYISGAEPLISLVNVVDFIRVGLVDVFSPSARDPTVLLTLGLLQPFGNSLQRQAYLWISRLTQFFIVLGIVELLMISKKSRFQRPFVVLSLVSTMLIVVSIAVPYLSETLNMSRIYQITLFCLAPFCILGGSSAFRFVLRRARLHAASKDDRGWPAKLVVAAVLIPYFLFGSGLLFEVTGAPHDAIAVDRQVDYPRFNQLEVTGAEWMGKEAGIARTVYADDYGRLLLYGYLHGGVNTFWGETPSRSPDSLVFLRCWNIQRNEVFASPSNPYTYERLNETQFYHNVLQNAGLVYDNGCAQAFI